MKKDSKSAGKSTKLEIPTQVVQAAFQGVIIKQKGKIVARFIWCLN